MRRYEVYILKNAMQDIDDLFIYITEVYKAPLTAKKYTEGLFNEVRKLSIYAESIPISANNSLKKIAKYPRRVNFRKHAIIYSVNQNKVTVRRIIPASLIQ